MKTLSFPLRLLFFFNFITLKMEVFKRTPIPLISIVTIMKNNLLKKCTWLLLFCGLSITAFSQEKFTLNGYIKDGETGETLIGASVFIKELGTGTTSNEYGFYSISIPSGTYTVDFGYIGFANKTETIDLTKNIKMDVEMGEDIENLVEVVVTSEAEDKNVSDLQMSVNKLDVERLKLFEVYNYCQV